jgi:hypothetical protein
MVLQKMVYFMVQSYTRSLYLWSFQDLAILMINGRQEIGLDIS